MVATFLTNWAGASRQYLDRWLVGVVLLCGLFLAPVLALVITASGDSDGLWSHLLNTVLGTYVSNTLILMVGVGVLAIGFGVSTAWVVSRYHFPGKTVMEWALLLPAAIPAYIIAYTYTDFFEYAGFVQSGLRSVFGWQTAQDYWFPEIRSLGGAILVMASVLYPYIYMVTRVAFRLTPASLFEIALVHNKSQFWTVGLPLARPAIMAGLALVLMEVVSDFGTVEYFAIPTITLGIFNVWLGMNNIVAAAQISLVGFVFIVSLLGLELYARARQQFSGNGKPPTPVTPIVLHGSKVFICWLICMIPLALGFLIPVLVLLSFVLVNNAGADFAAVSGIISNTLMIAGMASVFVMVVSCFIVLTATYRSGKWVRSLALLSSLGYAFPGTMLAIGVLIFASAFDRVIATITNGHILGILISGLGVLLFAYIVRFQAVGYGAMISGVRRLPPNMMNASRILGHGYSSSIKLVILPLLRSSLLAGGLLVFVDVMKELPMTLLLRPFNFETLATFTYQFAKDEMLEQAALPALMIVIAGLVPVALMNMMLKRSR
ncbi:ABC transporter permease [Candidatus Puniceispirillum marinum]|uniref:Binding-protein-dependent transport systems inner membrane component n=1 Tax=Puniceispirillum marinum (strain IMCC1322) TaxID=488538 RepID=D5BRW8_PUNMI|nr:iron ABC transporter permease [Candidatus Puniceispirillum marinum]ADE39015.1 binding-protein-dependent transport systems inner membrane component [Candidatus Puniceispirillum marinum IMCC1322]